MLFTRKTGFLAIAILSVLIGFYPLIYFLVDVSFGLLSTKSRALLSNDLWNLGFYTHITFGGLALLIGWSQFSRKFRRKYVDLHRNTGRVYMICVFFSGFSALYLSYYATGGIISSLGFAALGMFWMITTLRAFFEVKNGRVTKHRKFMTYSYAACFAAVTLRIWLPVLSVLFQDFVTAYRIVAWLCWVPNVIVAYVIIQNYPKKRKRKEKAIA